MNLNNLLELSRKIDAFRIKREAEQKVQHARFNVFTTVLQSHDEVRLHTRFLHMLLNPKEHHDCGRLFLDLFVDVLQESAVFDHERNKADLEKIISGLKHDDCVYGNNEESRSGYGRFDIYLEFKKHIILIENKINAGEQEQQIEQYAKFLLEKKSDKTSLLLYLTLDGKPSATANGNKYCRISYKDHILPWLEKCLQVTYSFVNINQSLQQYKQVVEQLTGQNQYGEKVMENLKLFLIEHPSVIPNVLTMQDIVKELYYDTIDLFFVDLLDVLKTKQIRIKERPKMVKGGFARDPWGGYVLYPEELPFVAGPNVELWLERSDPWNKLYLGLEACWDKQGMSVEEKRLLNAVSETIKEKCDKSGLNYLETTYTFSTENTFWPIGRIEILNPFFSLTELDFFCTMLNVEMRSQYVQDASKKIIDYIDVLRSELNVSVSSTGEV